MDISEKLGDLPAVETVLSTLDAREIPAGTPLRRAVTVAIREAIADLRNRLLADPDTGPPIPDPAEIGRTSVRTALRRAGGSLKKVVNLTGTVLHTNLGRAPLSRNLVAEIVPLLSSYSNLEYDLDERGRGSRYDHVAGMLREVMRCEAALVVNNNAAAVLLTLSELARDREVVVSRGELIEIGGGFRIPEVMAASGARLVEVGTTNRTRIADFRVAIGPDTAVLFRAHRSNFRMTGFVEEPSWSSVADLAREKGLISVVDLGGGLANRKGLPFLAREPLPSEILDKGIDLVCFSGDKLLGGPQAGVIAGRTALVARLRRNPLLRALRVGKLTIAALEATLARHLTGNAGDIPALAALALPATAVRRKCVALARAVRKLAGDAGPRLDVVPTMAEVGGGAAPDSEVPSFGLRVRVNGWPETRVERALRENAPPILSRIRDGDLILDLRTMLHGEERIVAAALARLR
jgi:L-seryl-tRNA(Ser) seleniumtransferase